MSPSVTPSAASQASSPAFATSASVVGRTSCVSGVGNAARMFFRNAAAMFVKSYAGAPATMPSKSSG